VLGQHNAVITGTGQLVREVSFYFGTWRPRQHPLYLHPFPPEPVEVPVASASRRSGRGVNFYHFVFDVLPRILIAEQCGRSSCRPLYVPRSTQDRSGLLDRLGITADRTGGSMEVAHVRAESSSCRPSRVRSNTPRGSRRAEETTGAAGYERVRAATLYITRWGVQNNRAVTKRRRSSQRRGARFEGVDPGALSIEDEIRTSPRAT